jgi:hypothetical protein
MLAARFASCSKNEIAARIMTAIERSHHEALLSRFLEEEA